MYLLALWKHLLALWVASVLALTPTSTIRLDSQFNKSLLLKILNSVSYCFSASNPPYLCAAAIKGLELLAERGSFLCDCLHNNTTYFHKLLSEQLPHCVRVSGHPDSVVKVLQLSNEDTPTGVAHALLQQVADACWADGVAIVKAVESPLLPELNNLPARLQIFASSRLSPVDIEHAAYVITKHCTAILK